MKHLAAGEHVTADTTMLTSCSASPLASRRSASPLTLLLCLPATLAFAPASPSRPHLVMAIIDDLGHAGLGFSSPLGEPHTPAIDALAAESAVLSRAYAFRFCSPTRSSFLTGRLPLHVNQQNHPPNVPGGETLPAVNIGFTMAGTVETFDTAGFEAGLLLQFPEAESVSTTVTAASINVEAMLIMPTAEAAMRAVQPLPR